MLSFVQSWQKITKKDQKWFCSNRIWPLKRLRPLEKLSAAAIHSISVYLRLFVFILAGMCNYGQEHRRSGKINSDEEMEGWKLTVSGWVSSGVRRWIPPNHFIFCAWDLTNSVHPSLADPSPLERNLMRSLFARLFCSCHSTFADIFCWGIGFISTSVADCYRESAIRNTRSLNTDENHMEYWLTNFIRMLSQSCPARTELVLKVGAQVILFQRLWSYDVYILGFLILLHPETNQVELPVMGAKEWFELRNHQNQSAKMTKRDTDQNRNLNVHDGLCNGSRGVIKGFGSLFEFLFLSKTRSCNMRSLTETEFEIRKSFNRPNKTANSEGLRKTNCRSELHKWSLVPSVLFTTDSICIG